MSTAPVSLARAARVGVVVEAAHLAAEPAQRETDRAADQPGADERDAIRGCHADPLLRKVGAERGRAFEEHVAQLLARPVGVAVDEHPDAPRHAVRNVLFLRAEQRDVVEPERGTGRAGRELGVRSGVEVKKMLTMSSWVRSFRANSSFTMRDVLASISALESSSHVIAPRSAWSFTTSEVSRGPPRVRLPMAGCGVVASYRRAHFTRAQRTPLARREPPVGNRTDARAHEPEHRVTDRVAHAPHLAVAALVDAELDRGALVALLHETHTRRRGQAVVELHAVAQCGERAGCRHAFDLGEVGLHHSDDSDG